MRGRGVPRGLDGSPSHVRTSAVLCVATGPPLHRGRGLLTVSVAAPVVGPPAHDLSPRVSMIAVDLRGTVISWNAAAESLFGITAADAVGQRARDLVTPADSTMTPATVMAEVRAGNTWEGEHRVRRRDGRELTLHVVNSPLYDDRGSLTGVLGVAVDVTAERLASLAVLDAVIVNSSTSVTVVGTDDRILLTMGDVRTDSDTKSSYVGRDIGDLIPDPAFRILVAQVRAGESARHVLEFGGRSYDSSIVQLPETLAGAGAVAFVATDITERVAEARRFQALIEKSEEVTSILAPDASVRYISPAIEALSGYTAVEFMGRPGWDLVHPDDLSATAEAFHAVTQAAGAVVTQVFRARHRDGTWRDVEQTMVNHCDDRAVDGIVSVARDVTVRVTAERRSRARNRLHAVLSQVGYAMARATDPLALLAEVSRILVDTGGFAVAAFTTHPSHPGGAVILTMWPSPSGAGSETTSSAAVIAAVRADGAPAPANGHAHVTSREPEILLFPVARRHDPPGVLVLLGDPDVAAMSAEDAGLIASVAQEVAFALDALSVDRRRAETAQLAIRRAEQQTIVSALGLMALGPATPAEVIDAAVASLGGFGLRQITVYERVQDADDLLVRAVGGDETPVQRGDVIAPTLVPMSAAVLQSGEPVTVNDFTGDDRFALADSPFPAVGSAVSVPIRAGGVAAAVLTVHSFDRDDFDAYDGHFYESIAHVISGSIERSRYEDAIRHEAMHDRLTGLTNRSLLQDRLGQALFRYQRRQSGPLAVLAADIDGFKKINGSLGHEAGDRLLTMVGERLREAVRPSDTVARLGGDEFVILCEDLSDPSEAAIVAGRVVEMMREEFVVDGSPISITMSIGVTASADGATVSGLLRDADAARYRAKEKGRDRFEVLDDDLRRRLSERADMEQALRQALDKGEFQVVYQPKVSLLTDRIVGVEALMRWNHPKRSIPPLEFIPVAEETGLIVPIGAWVLGQVCRDASRWRTALPGDRPLTVAVNVSPRQFVPGLATSFGQIIAEAAIDPATVCLEITESMIMQDPELAIATLRELKVLGLQISIDDFGTGFSSLAYLKRFPVDELKIDKSFIDGLGHHPEDTAIVAAIVGMAHALDLRAVAEGVEAADQLERLRTLGCDTAQGYFLGRPACAADIDDLLIVDAGASSGRERGTSGDGGRVSRVRRVMVVDDAADVRQLARVSLTAVGFEVAEASTGEAALVLISHFEPHCVVLDVHLPGMSGLEVCRILREDPAYQQTTIVMVSGDADPDEKALAFALRADDHMVKPLSPRDLVSRVTAAMRRRQAAPASATP